MSEPVKELKKITITEEEAKTYEDFDTESVASTEVIQEALNIFEKRRQVILKKKKTWWNEIYKKYDLNIRNDHTADFPARTITELETKKADKK